LKGHEGQSRGTEAGRDCVYLEHFGWRCRVADWLETARQLLGPNVYLQLGEGKPSILETNESVVKPMKVVVEYIGRQ
jgi:hypothetical protein